MPDDNSQYDSLQTPAPPTQQQSLPAILSAIGGGVLNLLGAATRTGAMGEGAVNLSQQLQQHQNEQQQVAYQRQVFETKREQERNVGKALSDRLGEVDNPKARAEIQTAVQNDQLPFAPQRFQNEIMQQRYEARQDKADRRLQNQDDRQMSQGLGDFVREHLGQAKQLQKDLPPQMQQALSDQAFFASQQKPFSDPEAFRQA